MIKIYILLYDGGIITDMGIIQRKELTDSLVEADVTPGIEIVSGYGRPIETKELPAEVEAEISGKEMLIAGLVVLALAGLALWLMIGR